MQRKFIFTIFGSLGVILASLVLINYLPQSKDRQSQLNDTGSFSQTSSPTISPIPTNHLTSKKNELLSTIEKYPDVKTIYQYYLLLSKGQLLDAYAMNLSKTVSKDQFIFRYSKLTHIEPDHFINIGPNTYTFSVDMTDLNNPKVQFYLVTMKVTGDKVQTISSEPIYHNAIKLNNSLAYSIARGNKDMLVFNDGGREKILAWEYNDRPPGVDFEPMYFSPKNTYLIYLEYYWEGSGLFLYRISDGYISKIDQSFITFYKMTPNEQKMVVCTGSMDGSMFGSIYDVPTNFLEFRHKFTMKTNSPSINCGIEGEIAVFEYKEQGVTKEVVKQSLN